MVVKIQNQQIKMKFHKQDQDTYQTWASYQERRYIQLQGIVLFGILILLLIGLYGAKHG